MGLPNEDFKFLWSIRSSILPVHVGVELLLEPYYPNRFARQSGSNQGAPSNCLSFIRAFRQQRSIMELAQARADLQRRDTGSKFYVPPSYYEGVCSWDYCSWWIKELWVKVVPKRNFRYRGPKKEKPRDLLASRARVSQSLSALRSMIDIYKLSIIEICWLSCKIKEIFGVVEIVAKIEELADVDQEILREDERTGKLREDLIIQQQNLIEADGMLKFSLYLKKREVEQVNANLIEARYSKLQDLEKEKDCLKI
ncbi:hypothetical protein Cgig2_022192 [Carnegiea gigantea]|uniref:Uncharacterized protein n=1 Tax=Carnegiea gigantea TaxID=171969 RepID=A0A9Q1H081_9CARY|nr:hypothetical protein Cgig2_022192 [Carnegiea gigantea]